MELITLLVVFFAAGGFIAAGIAMAVEVKKHRPVKAAANADGYVVAEDTKFTATDDTFLRTHTAKVKVSSGKPRK
jgi:hypothetical protein